MDRKLLSSLAVAILLIIAAIGIIAYARGYRLQPQTKTIQATGLLAATSLPTGASIYIDDRLSSATNTTINLPPGEYKIKITKEGLIPWEKTIKIQGEVVTRADPILFPRVPDLRRLTFLGADQPVISPDGQKIVFNIDNPDTPLKNGLWVLDMNNQTFGGDHSPRQISRNSPGINFSEATLFWAPDSKQILTSFKSANYLLDSSVFTPTERLLDVTATLPLILKDWTNEQKQINDDLILKLKDPIKNIASEAALIRWSLDETKFMYVSTESASIPPIIVPPLIGANSQPETRTIKPGAIYIYDVKEDKNFEVMTPDKDLLTRLLPSPSQPTTRLKTQNPQPTLEFSVPSSKFSVLQLPLQWYPSSRHLILTEKDKITIMDYDGTNKAVVYAGPFVNGFVFPWSDGSKLVILTSLNQSQPDVKPNLYSINLR